MCLDWVVLHRVERHDCGIDKCPATWTILTQTSVVALVRFVDNIFSRIVEIEDSRGTVGFIVGIAPGRCHVVLFVLMNGGGQGCGECECTKVTCPARVKSVPGQVPVFTAQI